MAGAYIVLNSVRLPKVHLAIALIIVAMIIAAGALAIPYGAASLGTNTGFLPAFGSLTFMGDFITALLLLSQARALNDRSLACLGAAYLFSATLIVPHLLAFPGVFNETPVIGSSGSAVWLWAVWHGGFALGVVNFALRRPEQSGGAVVIRPIILGIIGLSVALTLAATLGEPFLPRILIDGRYAWFKTWGISPAILACTLAGTALVLARLRRHASILLIWLTVAMVASAVDIGLTILANGRFTLGWYLARCLSLVAGFSVLCALLTDFVKLFDSVAKSNRQLEKLSLTDPLTEIANRRSFEQRLDVEWSRALREQVPVSLVMIDIDHFKRYNDHFGHPAGDECLRNVAAALTQHARRPWDMPARLGGEEFAVLLPTTEGDGAIKVAEMFRESIERLGLPHPESPFQIVTISVGVATVYPYEAGQTPKGLIEAADAALYVAKATGRNQVSQHVVPGHLEVIEGVMQQIPGLP